VGVKKEIKGVKKYSSVPFDCYNDENGLPRVSYTDNCIGSSNAEKTLFAYEIDAFQDMKNLKNMLSQKNGQKTLTVKTQHYDAGNVTITKFEADKTIPMNYKALSLQTGDIFRTGIFIKNKISDPGKTNFKSDVVDLMLYLHYKSGNTVIKNLKNDIEVKCFPQEITCKYQFTAADNPSQINDISLYLHNKNLIDLDLVYAYGDISESCEDNSKVVKANAYHWQQVDNIWRPVKEYIWVVPKDNSGYAKPGYSFADFDYSVENNQNWKTQNEVTIYDMFGNVIESLDPRKKTTTSIYGTTDCLPISTVVNSSFKECGVFTCDYDLNEDIGWFDKLNGWEKPEGAELAPQGNDGSYVHHFGNKCVKVTNSFGPTRNFKIEKGKDYIASAWVACASTATKVIVCTDYRSAAKTENLVFPFQGINGHDPKPTTISGAYESNLAFWKHLEIVIHAKDDLASVDWNSTDWFVRLFVGTLFKDDAGGPNVGHGIAYIDDIRFYPADAHLTTTYYDPKWAQPIVSADAGSKPGLRVTYDDFGRPVLWQKYDPNNHENIINTQAKTYHFSYGQPEVIYSNDFSANADRFKCGLTVASPDNEQGYVQPPSVVLDQSEIYWLQNASGDSPIMADKIKNKKIIITGYVKLRNSLYPASQRYDVCYNITGTDSPTACNSFYAGVDWSAFEYTVDFSGQNISFFNLGINPEPAGSAPICVDDITILEDK
jgi:hypothetical protein